jgi:pimeloyl-ACP methyl ester carboxylesterase
MLRRDSIFTTETSKSTIMKTIITTLITLLILITSALDAATPVPDKFSGLWLGSINFTADKKMRLAFEITNPVGDSLRALIHSIDQDVWNIEAKITALENRQINLVIPAFKMEFRGTLAGDSLIGVMIQNSKKEWPLHMARVNELPVKKARRPQEPVPPFPYLSEDIKIINADAGVTLAGTLTTPSTGGPFTAVVLIPGSGPNDRNETIFGHKVFLVLSDYLTRAGYAVLRMDDRGAGESTGKFSKATNEDFADDVLAGVEYLATRSDINPSRIGLIGHSLGADIAPIAASRSQSVAFIMMMAGAAVPLYQCINDQCEAIYPLMGVSPRGVALNLEINNAIFSSVKDSGNDSIARETIRKKFRELDPEVAKLSEKDLKILTITSPLRAEDGFYWLDPVRKTDLLMDPATFLKKVNCPVLAINGEKDLQVLPGNLTLIKEIVNGNGNENCTTKLFPGKNHLFQDAQTGSVSEYGKIETTIAPDVLEYLVNWLNQL